MGDTKSVPWAALLAEAVTKPGVISAAYSAFHNYSVGNQILAWMQCAARDIPLGPLATFKRWQALGRNVRRGEKALQLCMPVTIARKDDAGEKTGEHFQVFALRNSWFALAQTEGADYQHEAATPEWDATRALAALDIALIPFRHTNGNAQGYAIGRAIAINPVAALPHKTRFHELAHVTLGHTAEGTMRDDDTTPRDLREVEAESVAYICCATLGLPGLDESRGYLQAWLAGSVIPDKSAQRIFGAADKILKAGRAPIEADLA